MHAILTATSDISGIETYLNTLRRASYHWSAAPGSIAVYFTSLPQACPAEAYEAIFGTHRRSGELSGSLRANHKSNFASMWRKRDERGVCYESRPSLFMKGRASRVKFCCCISTTAPSCLTDPKHLKLDHFPLLPSFRVFALHSFKSGHSFQIYLLSPSSKHRYSIEQNVHFLDTHKSK